jgi:hypothetical protein
MSSVWASAIVLLPVPIRIETTTPDAFFRNQAVHRRLEPEQSTILYHDHLFTDFPASHRFLTLRPITLASRKFCDTQFLTDRRFPVANWPISSTRLVALRPTKISASDPPSTWWPGERRYRQLPLQVRPFTGLPIAPWQTSTS